MKQFSIITTFIIFILLSGIAKSQSVKYSGLIIKQFYYTGSKKSDGSTYFSDQFIEIYNNTDTTIYTDGLMIGDVYGVSGQITPGITPTPFKDSTDFVYINSIWQIPGSGTEHPLESGKSIIIAQDGINHKNDPNGNPNSPCDLSGADWETFNQRSDNRDLDAPNVPNLTRLYFTGGFDWLNTVFGPSLVIFYADSSDLVDAPIPGVSFLDPRKRLSVNKVIDGFEALMDASSSKFKRLPASVDAGFVYASGTYTQETAKRKMNGTQIGNRFQYTDTDNSSEDFEIKALTSFITDVTDDVSIPETFSLSQNYPNPFNPSTVIKFNLSSAGNMKLSVYNILGQEVALIRKGFLQAGNHQVNFNAQGLPAGIYIYSLSHNGNTLSKKMMLLK